MRNGDLNLRKLLSNPPVARKELSEELKHIIEQRIAMNSEMDLRKSGSRLKRRNALATGAAAVAAIVIAIGAFYTFAGQSPAQLPQSSLAGLSSKGTGLQFNRPAEVATQNWRVVIVKSLLKTGPYYDVQVFYAGKTSFPKHGLVFDWGNYQTRGAGAPLQTGDRVTGLEGGYYPQGFNLAPLKIGWVENGQSKSETIPLTDAKPDMEIENYHEYQGGNQNWSMSYAYETIVGENFHEPYGELVLKSKGKQFGNNVQYTIQSSSGAATMTYSNPPSDEIRMSVDPVQKGLGIHDPKAKVTIQSTDGTDTFDIDAVQSSQNDIFATVPANKPS